jgi:SAM-dependent methyltransferase
MATERDQKKFFDDYAARHQRSEPVSDFFFDLATTDLRAGFHWLAGSRSILEYGCGTGETIRLFLSTTGQQPARIVGIDLSEVSIQVAQGRLPYEFHVVPDNDLSFLAPGSIDSAYMIGVLHHTTNHQKIFDQVSRVLPPGGKFLILDLTTNNPFIEMARALFPYMPKRIKNMFPDDLVVDDTIPEKLGVDVPATLDALRNAGFSIERVDYSHLFYFLFDWAERATRIRLSRTRLRALYSWMFAVEKRLFGLDVFKRRAGSFVMRAVKSS